MSCPKLPIIFLICLAVDAFATPRDDLGAPSQEVRDAAARELRASFVAPLRSRWEPVVAGLKPGDTKQAVMEILQPYHVTPEGAVGSGRTTTENYRLDDAWVLECSFQRSNGDEIFMTATLHEQLRHVWIAPPQTFSGVWTTYFVNGQRSHEINYVNGSYMGTLTTFHPDGSKAVVQHYGPSGVDGEDTGYFPSGRIMYRAFYKNGAQVGTWTHYNEDGSVQSTKKYLDPTP